MCVIYNYTYTCYKLACRSWIYTILLYTYISWRYSWIYQYKNSTPIIVCIFWLCFKCSYKLDRLSRLYVLFLLYRRQLRTASNSSQFTATIHTNIFLAIAHSLEDPGKNGGSKNLMAREEIFNLLFFEIHRIRLPFKLFRDWWNWGENSFSFIRRISFFSSVYCL